MPNQYTASPRSVEIACAVCGTTFHAPLSRLANGRGKFCSRPCQAAGKIKPPTRSRRPVAERFFSFVNKTETCWLWTGQTSKNSGGMLYGRFWLNGKNEVAHRVSWFLTHGSWPVLPLDHVKARGCTSTLCVNPAHLEPVTQRENQLRGDGVAAINARKTHCPKSHPYSGDNLLWRRDGTRRCRTCERRWSRKGNQRRAAE